MTVLRRVCLSVGVVFACICGPAYAGAARATARTISVNAVAQFGVLRSSGGALQLSGVVSDPGIGNGGLVATLHPTAGGYSGTATFLNRYGSAQVALRVAVRTVGPLWRLNVTGHISGATGRFTGVHGPLTGSTTINPSFGVGVLRLRGALHGATGRAPVAPPRGAVQHVVGHFDGIQVSLNRTGEETVVGPATGVVPGPAVVVVHDRASATTVHGTFTMFTAGGSLSGVIDLRFRDRGSVRSEAGTATVTKGAGILSGARTVSPAAVQGTRDLRSQRIAFTIRGAFLP